MTGRRPNSLSDMHDIAWWFLCCSLPFWLDVLAREWWIAQVFGHTAAQGWQSNTKTNKSIDHSTVGTNSTRNWSSLTLLQTDMYQITMAYGYWKSGRHNAYAVFDLFFRTNPFKGEFTVFAGTDIFFSSTQLILGLEEVVSQIVFQVLCWPSKLRFVGNFRFSVQEINYLRKLLPDTIEPAFFDWLATVDCSKVKIYAVSGLVILNLYWQGVEGTIVFPRIPLLRVEVRFE